MFYYKQKSHYTLEGCSGYFKTQTLLKHFWLNAVLTYTLRFLDPKDVLTIHLFHSNQFPAKEGAQEQECKNIDFVQKKPK